MSLLPSKPSACFLFESSTPFWYIRLNNTRLADAVLDLCGVPAKEAPRRAAFSILTRFTAPAPSSLFRFMGAKSQAASGRPIYDKKAQMRKLESILRESISLYGMPELAAERLGDFVKTIFPLPTDMNESIESLMKAVTKIRSMNDKVETRQMKRFEEAGKSLRSLKDLYTTLRSLGLEPLTSRRGEASTKRLSRPIFISLDLGLRQRRKHYHGGVIYQCIALPDDFFSQELNPDDTNDVLISPSGNGTKVAEGGNFSDLVRRHRPPGNFAASILNYYTASPIPSCSGIRFSVGSLCALLYLDATVALERVLASDGLAVMEAASSHKSLHNKQGLEILRQSLGHPFSYSESVTCVVVSVNGMDAATTRERFIVASRLWAEGISAEYLPQSGMMLSLLRRIRDDSMNEGGSDWTFQELLGVCGILKVSFVVIVQPHLLKDRGSVRLRQYPYDTTTGSNETFVELENLASTIAASTGALDEEMDDQADNLPSGGVSKKQDSINPWSRLANECIFIENDQYYSSDKEVSKSETPHWKKYLKTMKSISISAESYLSSLQDNSAGQMAVFAAADLTFFMLRDFGTDLMRGSHQGRADAPTWAANQTADRYPKHRRTLKTLGSAIESYIRRQSNRQHVGNSTSSGRGGKAELLTFLLYSRSDDRFDMVTLEPSIHQGKGKNHHKRNSRSISG